MRSAWASTWIVDHVAFAATRKFDGFRYRQLTAAELGQIAGRAGRYMNDGTFGVTGRGRAVSEPSWSSDLEDHRFEPVRVLQWRNRDLDPSASLTALRGEPRRAAADAGSDQSPAELRCRRARDARP